MFIEASAQSASAFNSSEKIQIAFVSMVKNVELVNTISEKNYIFNVKSSATIGSYRQYSFESYGLEGQELVVRGEFTLVMQD